MTSTISKLKSPNRCEVGELECRFRSSSKLRYVQREHSTGEAPHEKKAPESGTDCVFRSHWGKSICCMGVGNTTVGETRTCNHHQLRMTQMRTPGEVGPRPAVGSHADLRPY